jgi:catechol 2,3-dioxygenase
MSGFGLPDETRIGEVHLRTRDLERALSFYCDVLGLKIVKQKSLEASLSPTGLAPVIIVLSEDSHATARVPRAIGLYHFAIRYPSRRALAVALQRLTRCKYPIEGASDHIVSEAIYLSDPEGNGVELYVDRPRNQWIWRQGQVGMATNTLDIENLLATAGSSTKLAPPPPEADIGHIHLHVADLGEAERFYNDFLGLAITQRSYPGALFFSAGGYHHHVAVNTWAGQAKPPENSVGLISYQLVVPVRELLYCLGHRAPLAGYEVDSEAGSSHQHLLRIRDPNGTWLEVVYAGVDVKRDKPAETLNR